MKDVDKLLEDTECALTLPRVGAQSTHSSLAINRRDRDNVSPDFNRCDRNRVHQQTGEALALRHPSNIRRHPKGWANAR